MYVVGSVAEPVKSSEESVESSPLMDRAPSTREQAMKRSDWPSYHEAELTEVTRLIKKGTFSKPCDLPPGQKALSLNFVYTNKVKTTPNGPCKVAKARLVCGGHRQQEWVNFDKYSTASPVLNATQFHILMAISAAQLVSDRLYSGVH